LSQYRWQYRLLVVFAPTSEYPEYLEQVQQICEYNEGYSERDLLVIKVIENCSTPLIITNNSRLLGSQLRPFFNIRRDQFSVLLIGKDGGIKLNSSCVINSCDLFDLIDSMPMRYDELIASAHLD
ncbi:DUF4174 domain-containing protein, partial [Pseudomonadota bacterium]